MAFPRFPDLPDDNPIEALRLLRDYLRVVVNTVSPYKLLCLSATAPILLFLLGWLVLGRASALSWASDLVPLGFAVISVVVSVKALRDEHQNLVIVFVLVTGVVGTIVMHIARLSEQTAHATEVGQLRAHIDDLQRRMDQVRDQNTQVLSSLVKPVPTSAEAEMERRENIQKTLRNEYILSHNNISPGLVAGSEFPPPEWMNKRLKELGETWTVTDSQSKQIVQMIQPEKSRVVFSLWPARTWEWPIVQKHLPATNGRVDITFSFQSKDHVAKGLRVWMRSCTECRYASEPGGFQALQGRRVETERMLVVGDFLPNIAYTPITVSLVDLPNYAWVFIDLSYACDDCDPVDPDKPQRLVVYVDRPQS